MLSDSTLLFSKMSHPTVQIHTFHRSAAIWFYWLFNIISKNLHLLSDSIQSIDQLFRWNKTSPCYQTLHYYYRKSPTLLCKSIHSIDQLQSDYIYFTLTFRKISLCWVIPYYISISCFTYILFVPLIILYNIILENSLSVYASSYIIRSYSIWHILLRAIHPQPTCRPFSGIHQ